MLFFLSVYVIVPFVMLNYLLNNHEILHAQYS